MDAENWDCPDNFSEDLDSVSAELDLYDIIKDEVRIARTVQELGDIKLSIGVAAFNSMKRFVSKSLLTKLDLYDSIKDELHTACTVQELRDIKRSIGVVAFNSMKHFANKELLTKLDLEDACI